MPYARIVNLGVIDKKAKPIYCEENIAFYREENDNYISIKPKKLINVNELVLNHTCKIILQLCNGKNTILDIYEELINLYNAKDNSTLKNTIYKDLVQIIHKFTKLSVIEYKEKEYPFMSQYEKEIKNGYKLSLADEKDIKDILDFIENYSKNNKYYNNPLVKLDEYTDLGIRNALYNYSEEYILIKNDNRINGIITIFYSKYKNNNVGYIGLVMADLNLLEDVVEYIKLSLKDLMVDRIDKIKYITTEQNEFEKILSKSIEEVGFKYEGILGKEIDGLDQRTYSLFL